MTAHTPGPWVAQPDPNGGGDDWCIGVDDWCICVGDRIESVATCSRRDARLISAAPDLLAALEELLALAIGPAGGVTMEAKRNAIAKACAALAKADAR